MNATVEVRVYKAGERRTSIGRGSSDVARRLKNRFEHPVEAKLACQWEPR